MSDLIRWEQDYLDSATYDIFSNFKKGDLIKVGPKQYAIFLSCTEEKFGLVIKYKLISWIGMKMRILFRRLASIW